MLPTIALLPVLLAGAPSTSLPPVECDFGVAHPWATASCNITLENDSKQDWVVRVPAQAGEGGAPKESVVKIAHDSSRQLTVPVKVKGRLGRTSFASNIQIEKGDKGDQTIRVIARGFVYSPLDQSDMRLDLGAIPVDGVSPKTLVLSSDDFPDFAIQGIVSAPEFVNATVVGKHKIRVALSDHANWGLNSGNVVVRINAPQQKTAKIMVTANVLGLVRPGQNPVPVGVVRKGNEQGFQVRVSSVDQRQLKIGDIHFEMGLRATTKVGDCIKKSAECRLIHVSIDPSQPTGNISSRMILELPAYKQNLTIGIAGVLVEPDLKLRSLDKLAEEKSQQNQSEAGRPALDIGAAVRKSVISPVLPPADPPGKGPVLRWSVANEQILYGYLIYRAEHKDGPWRRVNDKIIPVLGHDDATSEYAWRDTSAVKGKTYWYFIKTLGNNGTKARLTGVQKVVAH